MPAASTTYCSPLRGEGLILGVSVVIGRGDEGLIAAVGIALNFGVGRRVTDRGSRGRAIGLKTGRSSAPARRYSPNRWPAARCSSSDPSALSAFVA